MIKNITNLTFYLLLLILIISCGTPEKPVDLLVHNAKIYTVNDKFEIAEAMAIRDGNIVAIGAENKILNKYKFVAKEVIDAKKQLIYPGFIDAHCHLFNYAKGLNEVNLVGTNSFEEVLQKVEAFGKNNTS